MNKPTHTAKPVHANGTTTIEAEGRVYNVSFSWNAAVRYEEAAKQTISDALLQIADRKLSVTSQRAMLWAGLEEHHEDVSLEDAGRLIDAIGRRECNRVFGVALRYFFPELGGESAAAPSSPTTASAEDSPPSTESPGDYASGL
jgi:hypothetical protein